MMYGLKTSASPQNGRKGKHVVCKTVGKVAEYVKMTFAFRSTVLALLWEWLIWGNDFLTRKLSCRT